MRYATATAILIALAINLIAGVAPIAWLGFQNTTTIFDPYTIRVLTFTLEQALLSTLVSVLLGVPAALALARRKFPGRNVLISLLSLPMALPQIVIVLSLIAIFGAEGWLANTLPLYGLSGILLAHVFFNATLVARLSLNALQTIPSEQYRLAAQLGLSDAQHFLHIDWPALRASIVGTSLLVFLLCAASFTVVLTLGGGPQATTLEAAIYQTLRFDFDPPRAIALATLQLLLCLVLGLLIARFTNQSDKQTQLRTSGTRFDGGSPTAKHLDATVLAIISALLLLPLATLVAKGLPGISIAATMIEALFTSLFFSMATAIASVALAYGLSHAAARSSTFNRASQIASLAGLVLPPAVIATGWFILAINTTGIKTVAPILIIALNTLVALPYAYGTLKPAMSEPARQDRLAQSLGIKGWNRFWIIDRLTLAKPMSLALAMCFVVSLGDLAGVLFFGDGNYLTLPSLIYQQMGSYRMQGALGTALLLAALSWFILFLAGRISENA